MLFMNRDEIADAAERFAGRRVLGEAARLLLAFQEDVDRHSDGWPYWSAPVKAAAKLMTLVHGHRMAGMGAFPVLPEPTVVELRAALTPLKRFMTTRGRAVGMTFTVK